MAASIRQNYAEQVDQHQRFFNRRDPADALEKKLDAAFEKILVGSVDWLWKKTLLPKNFERNIHALSKMTGFVHGVPAGKHC